MGKEKETIELTEEEFLAKIKEANLSDNLAKYTAKIADKRVTEGVKSYEANRNKKDFTDKERLEAVETELAELKQNTAKGNINNLIEAELGKQNLSKGLLKYITVNSNDPSEIEKSVTDLKNDLLKIEQDKIDSKLKGNTPPVKGEPGKGGDSTLETYVESKNKGEVNSPFKGKI